MTVCLIYKDKRYRNRAKREITQNTSALQLGKSKLWESFQGKLPDLLIEDHKKAPNQQNEPKTTKKSTLKCQLTKMQHHHKNSEICILKKAMGFEGKIECE